MAEPQQAGWLHSAGRKRVLPPPLAEPGRHPHREGESGGFRVRGRAGDLDECDQRPQPGEGEGESGPQDSPVEGLQPL